MPIYKNCNNADKSIIRRLKNNYRNQRKVLALFKQILLENKFKTALEVGCGDGYFSNMARKYCREIITTDIKKSIAPLVLRNNNIKFIIADGTNLPFPDDKFDLVYSFDVIEHIKKDRLFIKDNLRVVKKGGILIIVTPNKNRLVNKIKSLLGKGAEYPLYLGKDYEDKKVIHVREYTKKELFSLIKETGFIIKQCEIVDCYFGLSGNLGLENCPKILENFCGTWFVKLIKK